MYTFYLYLRKLGKNKNWKIGECSKKKIFLDIFVKFCCKIVLFIYNCRKHFNLYKRWTYRQYACKIWRRSGLSSFGTISLANIENDISRKARLKFLKVITVWFRWLTTKSGQPYVYHSNRTFETNFSLIKPTLIYIYILLKYLYISRPPFA